MPDQTMSETIDFDLLMSLFRGSKAGALVTTDIRLCLRCGTEQEFSYQEEPTFGRQIYHRCPKCFEEKIFPWDGWFILTLRT